MAGCRRYHTTETQDGYALLVVVFLAAMIAISAAMVAENLSIRYRREKEIEMIWRGRQYVRAIRLYYQKRHHLPTALDDLYAPKTGVRFLRKPYSDPMNTADGSWRLIYVGPAGQMIGSLRETAAPLVSNLASNVPTAVQVGDALSPPKSSSIDPILAPANAALPSASGSNTGNTQSTQGSVPQAPAAPADPDPPFPQYGIIGVGSKIDKSSVIWLDGAKDYQHFEFIWKLQTVDPSKVTPNP